MPSFTFSSNTAMMHCPCHFDGNRFIGLMLLLAMLGGGALEIFWRSKGHFPVLADTASLWGAHVDKVSRLDSRSVVIVGGSRVQMGLDPDIVQKELGASRVVQLGRACSSPIPVLEYLTEATEYSGLVVCGVVPGPFFDAQDRQRKSIVEELEKRINRPFYTPMEEFLLGKAQSTVCLNNQGLSWKMVGNGVIRGNWPTPSYARFNDNRFVQADYTVCHGLDYPLADFLRWKREGAAMTSAGLKGMVEHLSDLAGIFKARGGRVVFVRMPSSGGLWNAEEESYPKQIYWHAIKQRFRNDAIHFHELELASGFTYHCPDGSHLDYRNVPQVAISLCAWLQGELHSGPFGTTVLEVGK